MTRQEFIALLSGYYGVDETEPLFLNLDALLEESLAELSPSTSFESLSPQKYFPLRLLTGSRIFSLRAGLAAHHYVVDSPEGSVNKTMLITNYQSQARELYDEYLMWSRRNGDTVKVIETTYMDTVRGTVYPYNAVVVPPIPTITSLVSPSAGVVEVTWSVEPFLYFSCVKIYGDLADPRDPYTAGKVRESLTSWSQIYDRQITQARVKVAPSGDYVFVVAVQDYNGNTTVSVPVSVSVQ